MLLCDRILEEHLDFGSDSKIAAWHIYSDNRGMVIASPHKW